MNKAAKWRRCENGQSVVEFALTLPLVLLLICGMIEMGWLATTRQAMDALTREGARAGIVATTKTASTTAVNARITNIKPSYLKKPLTVTITYSNPTSFKDGDITVKITYDLPPLTPITSFLAPGGAFHIVSSCTMKMS